MRNTWLVIKREYLERVRSKAFIISTLLMPVFVLALVLLPSLLMMKTGSRKVAVVSADTALAAALKAQIEHPSSEQGKESSSYKVRVVSDMSESSRKVLNEQIERSELDGYLWLSPEAEAEHKIDYVTKNLGDLITLGGLSNSVRAALVRHEMSAAGLQASQSEAILKSINVTAIKFTAGKYKKANPFVSIMLPLVLMMMLYMTVLIYGISVMRAVLEEKSSRVMEVMLSSLKPSELMGGKLLGVGAVGLTQMLVWTGSSAIVGGGQLAVMQQYMKEVSLPWPVLLLFPVFFLLGYLIYSSVFAAIGAMTNTQEEAQQFILPVMAPLMACTVVAMSIIGRPDGALSFWLSMFPLTAPIIMFLRIAVSMPPWWQILLSIAIQVLALWALVIVCSRIYRVGILMYGKRPTLPEIMKWLRYT